MKKAVILTMFAVLSLGLGPCGKSNPPAAEPSPGQTPAPAGAVITVRDILQNPAAYLGREITITGRFRGWAGHAAGPPPATKSDWVLQDDTGSIWVTGSFPAGCGPLEGLDRLVTIKARVKKTEDNRPYLAIE